MTDTSGMAWVQSSNNLKFSSIKAKRGSSPSVAKKGVWRHFASEIVPFRKRYELDLGHEEVVSLDYNSAKKTIRIGIKSGSEEYYATIKNGEVLRQRDSNTETDIDFNHIVRPFTRNIESLPNAHVLGLIEDNFGISRSPVRQGGNADVYISPYLLEKRNPRNWKENLFWFFFGRFPHRKNKPAREPFKTRFKRRYKADFFDIAFAALLAGLFYYFWVDFWKFGLVLAFFGMITGLLDWRVRKRNPLFSKIAVISGPAIVLFSYAWLYT